MGEVKSALRCRSQRIATGLIMLCTPPRKVQKDRSQDSLTMFFPAKLTASADNRGMNASSIADKLPAPEDRLAWRIAGVNWRVIAAMGVVLGLGLAALGLSIELTGLAGVAGIASLYGACGWYHLYRKTKPDPKMVLMLTSIGQLILIVTFMGPLTYVGGALNFPLQDQVFLAIDRALGVDPKMLLEFFNARPDWAAW